MKLGYVILVHKDPEQVLKLINSLDGEYVHFAVHMCKNTPKSVEKDFLKLLGTKKNVFFTSKRTYSRLFEFGLIEASNFGLEELINRNIKFDYVSLLSGQDFPIKSNKFIQDFFKKSNGKSYLKYWPINPKPGDPFYDNHPWGKHRQLYRIDRYHVHILGKFYSYPELESERLITKSFWQVLKIFLRNMHTLFKEGKFKDELVYVFLRLLLPKKRALPNFEVYGGQQWWSLSREAAEFCIKFKRKNKWIDKYFKFTNMSDEMYYQTILMNWYPNKDLLVNDFIREIEFDGGDGTHPIFYNESHLERLKHANGLFARKFNNIDLLEKVEEQVRKK